MLPEGVAGAGPTSMQDLPVSVQEAIFNRCDHLSQHALASTSRLSWKFYHEVKCVSPHNSCFPDTFQTARWSWRTDCTLKAGKALSSPFRADVELKPMDSSMFLDKNSCYHATLVGYLGQRHLQFILQHPNPLHAHLHYHFALSAASHFTGKLVVDPSTADVVIAFTLTVFHSRQGGFSDDELDRLSSAFSSFPELVCCNFVHQMRNGGAADHDHPVKLVCEPVWQLLSPTKHASCMHWDTKNTLYVHFVGNVSEVCSIG